jgi:SWI/SNF-related matrix-associated actin-dependent regulator 1 of chromatin subfamily A
LKVITVSEDCKTFIFKFPYAPEIVQAIKDRFSQSDRTWNPELKFWTVKTSLAQYVKDFGVEFGFDMPSEIEDLIEKANKTKQASKATNSNLVIPAPEGLDYLPYQKAGIEWCTTRDHALVADEMGLGKTIQALGTINHILASRIASEGLKVLVVAPASLKLNWQREAQKWLLGEWKIKVLKGPQQKQLVIDNPKNNLVIVSYDSIAVPDLKGIQARKDQEEKNLIFDMKFPGVRDKSIKPKKISQVTRPDLYNVVFDILICDEAHYLKNPNADRTKVTLGDDTKTLARGLKATKKIFLTGTPILNRPEELYPLLKASGHETRTFKSFCFRYGGGENSSELQERLRAGGFMIRRLKHEVLSELPAKRRQILVWEPETAAEKAAIQAEVSLLSNLKKTLLSAGGATTDNSSVVKKTRFEVPELAEISRVRHATALVKAPRIADFAEEMLDSGVHKLVIFAHHTDVIEIIKNKLQSFSPVVLTGETSLTKRQEAVDTFQNDPTCRVFIGGIRAAGVGLTLTASSTVLFAEQDWTPGAMQQAEDRTHRIGQKESVLSVIPVLDGSLDGFMATKIINKQEIISAALDNNNDNDTIIQNQEIEEFIQDLFKQLEVCVTP